MAVRKIRLIVGITPGIGGRATPSLKMTASVSALRCMPLLWAALPHRRAPMRAAPRPGAPPYLSLDLLVVSAATLLGPAARLFAEPWPSPPFPGFLAPRLGDFFLPVGWVPVSLGPLPRSPPCPICVLL